ncbi:MAG TPA: TonB-dependent receptor [Bacteroidales bacterium]|nr:TonB-dependent receptor [Bacteroidales bacterium]HSA43812.1 TonB-dependent receptor [Bacteroidales bacterium]
MKTMKFLLLSWFFSLFLPGEKPAHAQANRFTLSGYVSEAGSRELLTGVAVYVPEQKVGTTTNLYGFYSISLPQGQYQVVYSYIGYEKHLLDIRLDKDMELNISLVQGAELKGIEVKASAEAKESESVRMSRIALPVLQVKQLPALLGEKDVFKVLQLMPGVQKGTEGASGLYVRGGGPDQNLIILDDAPVYNASHLFGFFSLFSGDALKSAELVKGGFPARYGGRLSSVVEMNMKDGNKEKLAGEAGLGLISSRLTLEGPLVKDKASFLFSGRRTYIDLLIRPFMKLEEGVGGYYFYDLNAKLNYDFGSRNKLYLSAYFGRDVFYYRYRGGGSWDRDELRSGFYWQNATTTFRWNHLFNKRLFANTSLIFSNYHLVLHAEDKSDGDFFKLKYLSGIRDFALKSDFSWFPDPAHQVRYGLVMTQHRFRPGAYTVNANYMDIPVDETVRIDALESGLYAEDEIRLGEKIKLNPGIRLSSFVSSGVSYVFPEPRFSSSYALGERAAAKASYALMNQYVHLLSNTGLGLPTDLWVPSSSVTRPQRSQLVAAGYAYDFAEPRLSLTIEAYYKWMDHIIGYREGASFLVFNDPESAEQVSWEDNITAGMGHSTGLELLLQKKTGRLNGWVGYTLSWTRQQFDELNNGRTFYARYDRRHDLSLVCIYEISEKIVASGTWVFASGNPMTLPLALYQPAPYSHVFQSFWGGMEIYNYGEKNAYRMKNFHRLDLSIQFIKKIRKGIRTFEIGLFNAYNRRNPFFYFLERSYSPGGSTTVLKQVSLFPLIPSISYNLKF